MLCRVKDILRATGGTLLWGSPDLPITAICTDSRMLRRGEVFLALQGPNFDGNGFAASALERGALGIIVSWDKSYPDRTADTFGIQVPDTLRALGDFASSRRSRMNARIVTVAGSAGKTTTKDMTARVLADSFDVLVTEGNKNNLIGLPLTLLGLQPNHSVAVLEMGMNQAGELRRLTEIARPDVAVMTNIADAHIGHFGSIEKLIAAKAEVLEMLPSGSVLVANADCPNTARALEALGRPLQVLTFGMKTPADVMAEEIMPIAPLGYRVNIKARGVSAWVELQLFGRFQAYNALAAMAVGIAMGVDVETAAQQINQFRPASLRAEVETIQGVRLIKDCYNSSPSSTLQALSSLKDIDRPTGGRMVALLGDMMELDALEEHYHRAVGERAAQLPLDLVVTVGVRSRFIHQVVSEAGLPCRHYETPSEAGNYLAEALRPNDTLLVKGSRVMRLESAIETLKQHWLGLPAASPATPV